MGMARKSKGSSGVADDLFTERRVGSTYYGLVHSGHIPLPDRPNDRAADRSGERREEVDRGTRARPTHLGCYPPRTVTG